MFRIGIVVGVCFFAFYSAKADSVIGYTVTDADTTITSDISAVYTAVYGSSVGVYSTLGLNGGIADNVAITSIGSLYDQGQWEARGVLIMGSSSGVLGVGNIGGTINATATRGRSAGLYFSYVSQAEGNNITSNIYAQSQYDYSSNYAYGVYANASVLGNIGAAESEISVSSRGAAAYGVYSTGSGSSIGHVNGTISVTELNMTTSAYGISALNVGNIGAHVTVSGGAAYGVTVNNFGNISGSVETRGMTAYGVLIDARYYSNNGVVSGSISAEGVSSAYAVRFSQGGGTLHLSGNASLSAVCGIASNAYVLSSAVYSIVIDGDEGRQTLTGNISSQRDLTMTSGNFDFYSDSWIVVGTSTIGSLDSSTSVGFFNETTITANNLQITNAALNFHANTEESYGRIVLAGAAVVSDNSSVNLYLSDYFKSGVSDFELLIIGDSGGLLTVNDGYTVNLFWEDGSIADYYFDWTYSVDDDGLSINLISIVPETSSCAFIFGIFSLIFVYYFNKRYKSQKA